MDGKSHLIVGTERACTNPGRQLVMAPKAFAVEQFRWFYIFAYYITFENFTTGTWFTLHTIGGSFRLANS
jgi:hypothetical protein